MATKQDFDTAFEKYHRLNAAEYAHLVKWTAVTSDQLAEAEQSVGIHLPVEFKEFLSAYGYGEFYFATIFCPLTTKPNHVLYTMWDYFTWNQFGGNYVPISSNGDELWTGFRVKDKKCSDQLVNFDVDEKGYTGDGFESIWDFLLQVALVTLP